ncbi:MAG: aminopeptidase [Vulcanimicrobiota bacterium]
MVKTRDKNFLKNLAKKIVVDCLRVKSGENFWISCSDPAYFDLAEKTAIAAIEEGAYPFITMSSEEIGLKKMENPPEYFKASPEFALNNIETADVQLQLAFPKDPAYPSKIPPEKLKASSWQTLKIHEALMERNKEISRLRCSSLIYPTREAADYYGIPFDEYEDLIWRSLDIDYNDLSGKAKTVASILRDGEKIHITTDDGTDLKFSIGNRQVFIDDGIMDEEDIQTRTYLQNLPTGEVYVAPLEDSVEGTAVFQYNIFMGEPLVNLRAEFKKGTITDFTADRGEEHYRAVMENCTGGRYTIAELGIGLNPEIKEVVGNLAMDEKIIGTIHLATGENRMFGGTNKSSIHWDLVMKSPTVAVDGKVIMEKGRYRV